MRDYELVLVIDPGLSGADRKKQVNKAQKIVEAAKGKVEKKSEWGQMELAYPIKKKTLGYYFLLEIGLPSGILKKVRDQLILEDKIIRYLLVKKE
ncbi:30S ribosomal protein S6 [Microgenomates group bacterium RBG_19FT_COMBO_39_10]|nr:MAG: 30S ribosomal protein S6 [Microgenomates group bacterium RBG_19FT_COMBO_39_10]